MVSLPPIVPHEKVHRLGNNTNPTIPSLETKQPYQKNGDDGSISNDELNGCENPQYMVPPLSLSTLMHILPASENARKLDGELLSSTTFICTSSGNILIVTKNDTVLNVIRASTGKMGWSCQLPTPTSSIREIKLSPYEDSLGILRSSKILEIYRVSSVNRTPVLSNNIVFDNYKSDYILGFHFISTYLLLLVTNRTIELHVYDSYRHKFILRDSINLRINWFIYRRLDSLIILSTGPASIQFCSIKVAENVQKSKLILDYIPKLNLLPDPTQQMLSYLNQTKVKPIGSNELTSQQKLSIFNRTQQVVKNQVHFVKLFDRMCCIFICTINLNYVENNDWIHTPKLDPPQTSLLIFRFNGYYFQYYKRFSLDSQNSDTLKSDTYSPQFSSDILNPKSLMSTSSLIRKRSSAALVSKDDLSILSDRNFINSSFKPNYSDSYVINVVDNLIVVFKLNEGTIQIFDPLVDDLDFVDTKSGRKDNDVNLCLENIAHISSNLNSDLCNTKQFPILGNLYRSILPAIRFDQMPKNLCEWKIVDGNKIFDIESGLIFKCNLDFRLMCWQILMHTNRHPVQITRILLRRRRHDSSVKTCTIDLLKYMIMKIQIHPSDLRLVFDLLNSAIQNPVNDWHDTDSNGDKILFNVAEENIFDLNNEFGSQNDFNYDKSSIDFIPDWQDDMDEEIFDFNWKNHFKIIRDDNEAFITPAQMFKEVLSKIITSTELSLEYVSECFMQYILSCNDCRTQSMDVWCTSAFVNDPVLHQSLADSTPIEPAYNIITYSLTLFYLHLGQHKIQNLPILVESGLIYNSIGTANLLLNMQRIKRRQGILNSNDISFPTSSSLAIYLKNNLDIYTHRLSTNKNGTPMFFGKCLYECLLATVDNTVIDSSKDYGNYTDEELKKKLISRQRYWADEIVCQRLAFDILKRLGRLDLIYKSMIKFQQDFLTDIVLFDVKEFKFLLGEIVNPLDTIVFAAEHNIPISKRDAVVILQTSFSLCSIKTIIQENLRCTYEEFILETDILKDYNIFLAAGFSDDAYGFLKLRTVDLLSAKPFDSAMFLNCYQLLDDLDIFVEDTFRHNNSNKVNMKRRAFTNPTKSTKLFNRDSIIRDTDTSVFGNSTKSSGIMNFLNNKEPPSLSITDSDEQPRRSQSEEFLFDTSSYDDDNLLNDTSNLNLSVDVYDRRNSQISSASSDSEVSVSSYSTIASLRNISTDTVPTTTLERKGSNLIHNTSTFYDNASIDVNSESSTDIDYKKYFKNNLINDWWYSKEDLNLGKEEDFNEFFSLKYSYTGSSLRKYWLHLLEYDLLCYKLYLIENDLEESPGLINIKLKEFLDLVIYGFDESNININDKTGPPSYKEDILVSDNEKLKITGDSSILKKKFTAWNKRYTELCTPKFDNDWLNSQITKLNTKNHNNIKFGKKYDRILQFQVEVLLSLKLSKFARFQYFKSIYLLGELLDGKNISKDSKMISHLEVYDNAINDILISNSSNIDNFVSNFKSENKISKEALLLQNGFPRIGNTMIDRIRLYKLKENETGHSSNKNKKLSSNVVNRQLDRFKDAYKGIWDKVVNMISIPD